jgi:hypothetical protein
MGEMEYQPMSTLFDCVWLLETLSLFFAGVDRNKNLFVLYVPRYEKLL